MMRVRHSIFASVLLLALASTAHAGDARKVQVGEMASRLAAVVDGGTASMTTAARLQLAAGEKASAGLTERAAVAMLKAAGIDATTSKPNRLVTGDAFDAYIRLATSGQAQLQNAATLGKPGSITPASLDDCFTLKNHGQCVECCKSLNLPASSCAKSCFVINKPSPSEPLP